MQGKIKPRKGNSGDYEISAKLMSDKYLIGLQFFVRTYRLKLSYRFFIYRKPNRNLTKINIRFTIHYLIFFNEDKKLF